MAFLLGIDIGTSGTKALVCDLKGRVLSTAMGEHEIASPHPGWSEQDPQWWWRATIQAVRVVVRKAKVKAADCKGIGLSGQMHGSVFLSDDGPEEPRALRPALLWNDQRTAAECEAIEKAAGGRRKLIGMVGNPALTGFTAPKILWVRDHEPEVYGRIAHVLLPKDYIRFRLTGAYATDLAGAAGTLLLDVANRDWSQEALQALDIPPEWMPRTHEGTAVTGTISDQAARQTGLKAGIPVVGGGGDQAAQAVGVGAVVPGRVALTVGTSGVVFAPLASYAYEPEGRLHAFCHAAPGQWCFMGVMLSAAGSLQWYRDTLAPEIDFHSLLGEVANTSPGSDGLLFLPYLSGERTPHPDPLARGAFVGLTVRHGRAHLTRAVLEGVAFGLRDSFEMIKQSEAGREINEIRVSGGGARNPLWRQILADVLQSPLTTVEAVEGAAYGAALLAGVGAGVWPNVEAAADVVRTGDTIVPGDDAGRYDRVYDLYRSLYPTLKDTFAAISEM